MSALITQLDSSPECVVIETQLLNEDHLRRTAAGYPLTLVFFMTLLVRVQDGDNTIITALNHHIMSIQDAIVIASSPSLLAVVLSPLCRLIPRSIPYISLLPDPTIPDQILRKISDLPCAA